MIESRGQCRVLPLAMLHCFGPRLRSVPDDFEDPTVIQTSDPFERLELLCLQTSPESDRWARFDHGQGRVQRETPAHRTLRKDTKMPSTGWEGRRIRDPVSGYAAIDGADTHEVRRMAEFAETVNALKVRWEQVERPDKLRHRLRRCISWLERASAENDVDTKCILLWVAFNAAYAIDRKAARQEWGRAPGEPDPGERDLQKSLFQKLARVAPSRIRSAIRTRLWGPVPSLMNNEYVFLGFWESLTDEEFDWDGWDKKKQFEKDRDAMPGLLQSADYHNTLKVLRLLFSRLYVLRNQLMHGCATRDGALNRRQVEDGAAIREVLVPLFVDIMADHPEKDWGRISFPVRPDIREDLRKPK